MNTRIVEVDAENIAEHPQVVCFINPKHDTYYRKIDWLKSEFERGLRIKLLYVEGEKRAVGYVEYVPGEHCWRAVDARGYVFIHCIWTNGKKHQHLGLGGRLLQEVEKNAGDYEGVVALTSDGSFMASKELFVRHGYSLLEEKGKEQLMCKRFAAAGEEAHDDPRMHDSAGHYPAGYEPTGHDPAGGSGLPSFLDNSAILDDHRGLTIFYSKQCPWVAGLIEEAVPVWDEWGIEPEILEYRTPREAQQSPSPYGIFNLVYNGKILADRYVSTTRLENILRKELG